LTTHNDSLVHLYYYAAVFSLLLLLLLIFLPLLQLLSDFVLLNQLSYFVGALPKM